MCKVIAPVPECSPSLAKADGRHIDANLPVRIGLIDGEARLVQQHLAELMQQLFSGETPTD